MQGSILQNLRHTALLARTVLEVEQGTTMACSAMSVCNGLPGISASVPAVNQPYGSHKSSTHLQHAGHCYSQGQLTCLPYTASASRPAQGLQLRLFSASADRQPSSSGESGSSSSSTGGIPLLKYSSEALAKLTPQMVVQRLNSFIIGQEDAKKAVAVAFRNRWRRHRVPADIREDITPKNILMIGPTGCGKTEIARRLAKLADAPFIKVEATKFTEVGYHGRDVDSIIKDLVEASITLVRTKLKEHAHATLAEAVEKRLLTAVATSGSPGIPEGASNAVTQWALQNNSPASIPPVLEALRKRLRAGELEGVMVEVELPAKPMDLQNLGGGGQAPVLISLERLMSGAAGRKERKRLPVREARGVLEDAEAERLYPQEVVVKEAIRLAEQDGIVFIDEIDKVVSSRSSQLRTGDPSSEGVQRDLLPIIEGSTVQTKHGNVNTDHILFICSGAFHSCKPSDLMAELQGRLPIRVELKALTQHDFYRILTEPQYNLIKQQQMLLATEGVDLIFTDQAVHEIARLAEEINRTTDNIGARRLAAVLERCVEQVSFAAPELVKQARSEGKERFSCVVDKENVEERVAVFLKTADLHRFIL